MNRSLYELRFTKKFSGKKVVLLIICFRIIAEMFSIEALPVESHLMFLQVGTATFLTSSLTFLLDRVKILLV